MCPTYVGKVATILSDLVERLEVEDSLCLKQLVVYGILFLATILLLPEGIIPTLSKFWLKWQASRRRPRNTPALNQGDGLLAGSSERKTG